MIESSARSTFEEKIDALGRVLADGLQEDGDIAEAPVIAQALHDLADVMEPPVATLSGIGLLRDNTGVNYASQPGPEAWVVTSTKLRCLFLLDPEREG